ncbi:hypothetical protein ACFE04_002151 [Oxalis oulophora]
MTISRLLVPCCRIEKRVDHPVEEVIKKKVNQEENRRNSFRNIVKTISLKTGSSKQRTIAAEIRKLGNAKASPPIVFTFYELEAATTNFHPNYLIGEGGFGTVYKGYIKNLNKVSAVFQLHDVAVKQLDRNGLQGSREFFSEVLMLSHVEHPNLVNLIGYCVDGDQRVLVYEFMPNESLEIHLFGQLTTKSDVYSFGVVLLELITGRRAVDIMKPSDEQSLIDWAEPLLKDRSKFPLLVDPLLKGKYPEKGLCQALAIAAMCLQEEASTRPFIGDVVSALQFLVHPSPSSRKTSVKGDLSRKNSQSSNSVQEGSSQVGRNNSRYVVVIEEGSLARSL